MVQANRGTSTAALAGAIPAETSCARAPASFSCSESAWSANDLSASVLGRARLLGVHRGDFLELLGVVERRHLIEQLADVAFEHVVELMSREVDAMVGDAALREVIRANLFGSFAGAHLAAPILGDRVLLFLHLHFIETRAQHFHRLRAILDLRLLILLRHDDAGGDVREANS